jgi:hypothetical protein
MTLPSVSLEDVPLTRAGRRVAGMLALVAGLMGLGAAGVLGLLGAARTEAAIVTRAVLASDLVVFKEAAAGLAATAAREGARQAVSEAVVPLARDVSAHNSRDEEIARRQQDEIDRLRARLDARQR